MNNFEVVINGVNIAAKVLGLDPPEIRFYKDNSLTSKGINSMYIKESNTVAFDDTWIEMAEWIEIIIVCFHEVRHHFQYQIVNSMIESKEFIPSDTKEKWKFEFQNYQKSNNDPNTSNNYLNQLIEIDAISFSYYMIQNLFGCEVYIPKQIIDRAKKYSEKFGKLY
jgi:hypothetical protein